jgi:hypothetical protein
VPSTYKVLVSPSNLELLAPTLKPLAHELRQAVAHHATYEGYSLAGEAVIAFEHDENLGPNECVIRPSQVSSVPATPVEPIATEPAPRNIVIADHNVSRVHAEIKVVQGSWRIDDRGSTNGTRVNGAVIVEPTPLASGDVIAFGAVNIHFE